MPCVLGFLARKNPKTFSFFSFAAWKRGGQEAAFRLDSSSLVFAPMETEEHSPLSNVFPLLLALQHSIVNDLPDISHALARELIELQVEIKNHPFLVKANHLLMVEDALRSTHHNFGLIRQGLPALLPSGSSWKDCVELGYLILELSLQHILHAPAWSPSSAKSEIEECFGKAEIDFLECQLLSRPDAEDEPAIIDKYREVRARYRTELLDAANSHTRTKKVRMKMQYPSQATLEKLESFLATARSSMGESILSGFTKDLLSGNYHTSFTLEELHPLAGSSRTFSLSAVAAACQSSDVGADWKSIVGQADESVTRFVGSLAPKEKEREASPQSAGGQVEVEVEAPPDTSSMLRELNERSERLKEKGTDPLPAALEKSAALPERLDQEHTTQIELSVSDHEDAGESSSAAGVQLPEVVKRKLPEELPSGEGEADSQRAADTASQLASVSSPRRLRRFFEPEEDRNLIEGVKKHGAGMWKQIRLEFQFNQRSPVDLKDRWRTLGKQASRTKVAIETFVSDPELMLSAKRRRKTMSASADEAGSGSRASAEADMPPEEGSTAQPTTQAAAESALADEEEEDKSQGEGQGEDES